MTIDSIRNFCIIAHIDHGKSTLADRILEMTGAIPARELRDQVLDDMELEREHGITIKARAVKVNYQARDGRDYIFNLIDTPGHVDFAYEVSRSLAACEGAILLVDGVEGVQAQTVANLSLAREEGLKIVPAINKIDLPNADPERVEGQLRNLADFSDGEFLPCSAREGRGIGEIMEAVASRIPPPQGSPEGPLRALIFDSIYDAYRGVILYLRIVDGELRTGMEILLMRKGKEFLAAEVGIFKPKPSPVERLFPGEVGYLIANIREAADMAIGDTVTLVNNPAREPLPGYRPIKPRLFCGLYPTGNSDFESLRSALSLLNLNDSSFVHEPERSSSLGLGFRCGFLGLLHMQIVEERLEREYNLELIATVPNIVYRIVRKDGKKEEIDNPAKFPEPGEIGIVEEPYIRTLVITPAEFLGGVMRLMEERQGERKDIHYLDESTVSLTYEVPWRRMVIDFHDRLKSVTHGYGSFDYEHIGFRPGDLVRLDILLNGQQAPLSTILHRDDIYRHGRMLTARLKETIPQQLFPVAIQASVGKRVIARETKKALRKDVTAKLYGGDITRKMKLLEKQKAGKRRMTKIGKVEVPQEAFLAMLRMK